MYKAGVLSNNIHALSCNLKNWKRLPERTYYIQDVAGNLLNHTNTDLDFMQESFVDISSISSREILIAVL